MEWVLGMKTYVHDSNLAICVFVFSPVLEDLFA